MGMPEVRIEDYLGRKTLILGDVNTGKTTLSRGVLEALCRQGFGGRTAVVDMAPEIPETLARARGIPGAGGRLIPPEGCGVLYLGGWLEPPRLSSNSEEEAMQKARRNRREIEGLLRRLDSEPREILLVNDVSLYLQAGGSEAFIPRLERPDTVVANGYWGERLGGGLLSGCERSEMQSLRDYFDRMGRTLILKGHPVADR